MNIDVKLRKEVVWEKRFNLLNDFSITVLKNLEKGKKNFYLLVRQMRFDAVLVAGFGLNDVP
jgi:hypothetical protein